MPMTFSLPNPWKRSTLWGLVLGVWFFQPLLVPAVLAVDSTSPLFDQGQTVSGEKGKSTQPLALPEETPNPSPSLFSTLLRVFFALALIVGLIVVTVWGVKLVWEKQGWSHFGEQGKPIKVLASTYLAPRKAIHLVEVGKRLLVVGMGNDEIHRLDVITDPAEVEALRQTSQGGFPKVFNSIVQKHEAAQHEEDAGKMIAEGNQLVGGYVEKLKKISKKRKEADGDKTGGE